MTNARMTLSLKACFKSDMSFHLYFRVIPSGSFITPPGGKVAEGKQSRQSVGAAHIHHGYVLLVQLE